MAWSNSKIFRSAITDMIANVAPLDFDSDAIKVSLHNNSITPDLDVASAASAYNTGVWTTTNEVSQAGQWAAAGVALTSKTLTNPASGVVMADAADTASGAAATLANVYGCLVYDDTVTAPVADQGFCYNYFGGANSVTSGTLTVVWNANGIFRFTVA